MSSSSLEHLPVKIFADGADLEGIAALYRKPFIRRLTTNPTLMRKAGIRDYEAFAKSVPEMHRQALKIEAWQSNVYVKIPITNTRGDSSIPLIRELAADGVQLNITAVLTRTQVEAVVEVLNPATPAVLSVFAGRVADTGVDPMPLMRDARRLLTRLPRTELLWASVREVLNIFQAAKCDCQIVTVPHDVLGKASLCGMDLAELSLDTVKIFTPMP